MIDQRVSFCMWARFKLIKGRNLLISPVHYIHEVCSAVHYRWMRCSAVHYMHQVLRPISPSIFSTLKRKNLKVMFVTSIIVDHSDEQILCAQQRAELECIIQISVKYVYFDKSSVEIPFHTAPIYYRYMYLYNGSSTVPPDIHKTHQHSIFTHLVIYMYTWAQNIWIIIHSYTYITRS